MKKFLALACAFVFLLGNITAAFAAGGTTYQLEELGMSVEIPSDHVVFTRDTPKDDPNYAAYGLTKEDMDELFDAQSIYLNAWDADIQYEIVVTMAESFFEDFHSQSDTALSALASDFDELYQGLGYTLLKTEIYHHKQTKFIKLYTQQGSGDEAVYILQYCTTYNDQTINITMRSFSGKVDDEKECILKDIVDTVNFLDLKEALAVGGETAPVEYRDNETGVSFIVPANWSQYPLDENQTTSNVEFVSKQKVGLSIVYGHEDYWGQLTEQEKRGSARADIDNSILNDSVVALYAKGLGDEDAPISKATYAEKEYYRIDVTSIRQTETISLPRHAVVLIRIENGYLFQFLFLGEDSSPYFKDFESLMNSVQYPSVSNTEVPSALQAPQEVSPSIIATGVIIIIVLGLLFFAWFSWNRASERAAAEARVPTKEGATMEPPDCQDLLQPTTEGASAEPGVVDGQGETATGSICRRCGTRLPPDSIFCHTCGTKVETTGDEQN